MRTEEIIKLNTIAKIVRKNILLRTAEAGGSHYMSSFSSVKIFVSLFSMKSNLTQEILTGTGLSYSKVMQIPHCTRLWQKPVPMMTIGVNDRFGGSGQVDELYRDLDLIREHIVKAVHEVMKLR